MNTLKEFWDSVDKTSSPEYKNLGRCWVWTKGLFTQGYGQIYWRGVYALKTHRLSWEFAYGPVPQGLTIAKARLSHTGVHLSKFHRQQISASLKGKKKSPEAIEKTRLANLGKKLSVQHREAIRKSLLGNKFALGKRWQHTPHQLQKMEAGAKRYALRRHMDYLHNAWGL